jgi:hypothetical protein
MQRTSAACSRRGSHRCPMQRLSSEGCGLDLIECPLLRRRGGESEEGEQSRLIVSVFGLGSAFGALQPGWARPAAVASCPKADPHADPARSVAAIRPARPRVLQPRLAEIIDEGCVSCASGLAESRAGTAMPARGCPNAERPATARPTRARRPARSAYRAVYGWIDVAE